MREQIKGQNVIIRMLILVEIIAKFVEPFFALYELLVRERIKKALAVNEDEE